MIRAEDEGLQYMYTIFDGGGCARLTDRLQHRIQLEPDLDLQPVQSLGGLGLRCCRILPGGLDLSRILPGGLDLSGHRVLGSFHSAIEKPQRYTALIERVF